MNTPEHRKQSTLEADMLEKVAKEHWFRSGGVIPDWGCMSKKQRGQHIQPASWWISLFKDLGLLRLQDAQPEEVTVEKLKQIFPRNTERMLECREILKEFGLSIIKGAHK